MAKPNLIARSALLIFFFASLCFSAVIALVTHATGNEKIAILIPLSPSLIAIIITVSGSGRRGLRAMFEGRLVGGLNLG